jgi:hypothetical protein
VEAEVYRALEPSGVPVPHVWAIDDDRDALLVDRIPGAVWFRPPSDPAVQEEVARDFVRHLACWHSRPASSLRLPSLGPVQTLPEHQAAQLDGISRLIELSGPADAVDPLVTFTLEWLRQHIPDAEGPVVLVQGDTGPGNFLYAGNRVTGVIDWELAHLGDPMDDIAWLSWRATQHGFPDFPARLREYEVLSGIPVDDDRVRYYRLNAFGRLGPHFALADMGLVRRRAGARPPGVDGGADNDRAADGSEVIMTMLHRRMRLEATAAALGTPVPPRELVEDAPRPAHDRMYDRLLDQMRLLVGRVEDPTTASIGKAVARQLKYLKELDRSGDFFAGEELEDIAQLLGRSVSSLDLARPELVEAVRSGTVGIDDYLDYHWRRLRRDDHLMRFASGALYDRSWPALR